MIYCVSPQALADELYDRMVSYYENDPNVTVIIDRREGPDRRRPGDAADPVTLVSKGQELDELDESMRDWNASASADGKLAVGVRS